MTATPTTSQTVRSPLPTLTSEDVNEVCADALDLQIKYQPTERVPDVQITLTNAIADISPLAPPDHRVGPASHACPVPPVGVEPTLSEV